ncbi:hypothetical protein HPB47_009802 [Ixodes persulcatus]|uniref:Uncharacterized protein n=1 Tax=Ixodes persulcatus TaxID=34615 RepID=A0AC60P131_IXOPE|nr:hypothetical protein HPB47_009802 [Ixodes persulcatus]
MLRLGRIRFVRSRSAHTRCEANADMFRNSVLVHTPSCESVRARTVVTVVPWSYTQCIVVAMDPDLKRRLLQRCQQLGLRPYEDTPHQPEGVRSDRRETTAREESAAEGGEAGASTSSSKPPRGHAVLLMNLALKTTTMKDLSDEATLRLIALVEEIPQLWCLQNDQYHNNDIKSELWKQIANEMERRYSQYGPYTEGPEIGSPAVPFSMAFRSGGVLQMPPSPSDPERQSAVNADRSRRGRGVRGNKDWMRGSRSANKIAQPQPDVGTADARENG